MLTDADLQTWQGLQTLSSPRQRVLDASAFLWRFYDALQHADLGVLERAEATLVDVQKLEFASDPALLCAFFQVSVVCGKHATAAKHHQKAQTYLENALSYLPVADTCDGRLAYHIAVPLSVCWYVAARYRDVVELTETYLPLTQQWADPLNEARLLNTRGITLRVLGRYRPALEALQSSYRLYVALDHPELERPTANLASFYNHLGQIEQSKHYFARSLELSRRYGLVFDEALTTAQLGDQQLELDNDDDALAYYQVAITKLAAAEAYDVLAVILANAAIIYTRRGELERANEHLQQALTLIEHHPHKRYHMVILYSLGLLQQARGDACARDTLEDALARAIDIEEQRFQTFIHQALADVYRHQGDFANAFEHLSIFQERHSAQLEQKRHRTMAGLTLEFEVEREQQARAQAEYALKTQTELLERITDGFLAIDEAGLIIYANHVISELSGKTRLELIGQYASDCFPNLPVFVRQRYREAIKQKHGTTFEFYFDHQQRWYDLRIYPSQVGTTVYMLDVSERKQQDAALRSTHVQLEHAYTETASKVRELEQLHHELASKNRALERLSQQDGLTKLFNRRTLDTLLGQEFQRANRYHDPLSVMLCDIDNFKQINDRLSHAIGDEVLRQLAVLFSHHTRDQDIVARYGGEEFVIVFPETSLENAAAACEKLRQHVTDYAWQAIHPELSVTLSMGLTGKHPHFADYEAMLKAADAQMYRAKTSGKNRLCF
jgi:diguanylate cyclase (GGDEF)-like protein/PAS domain S-box-containing protein